MLNSVLIVAAGAGLRAGGEKPKQYQKFEGMSLLRHTLSVFCEHPDIDSVFVVISEDHLPLYQEATSGLLLPDPIFGGKTRQESVFLGLQALREHQKNTSRILIHDAARPFVSPALISRVLDGLSRSKAAVPALLIADTVVQKISPLEGEEIGGFFDRASLRAVQTPQGFHFFPLFEAHLKARACNEEFSDDSSLAYWAGLSVLLVAGEEENQKITTSKDIKKMRERTLLRDIRIGQGVDVHGFCAGDHVVLCGVKIPHTHSLLGHSDADVALHALTDALLGALGEGDIGVHFPPSDPQWKGAASVIFLTHAMALLKERGGEIGNLDLTLLAEAPKISPYLSEMKAFLSAHLKLSPKRIAIKATTTETLGFVGRREGILALACVSVFLPQEEEDVADFS